MSARLKLKKLKKEMELVRNDCSMREEEAKYEKLRCYRLLNENIQEIEAFAEFYPYETMSGALDCLKYNIHKITDSIVHKYTEQLAEFVRNQLIEKYAINRFSTIGVTLLAPAINEDHIKVKTR